MILNNLYSFSSTGPASGTFKKGIELKDARTSNFENNSGLLLHYKDCENIKNLPKEKLIEFSKNKSNKIIYSNNFAFLTEFNYVYIHDIITFLVNEIGFDTENIYIILSALPDIELLNKNLFELGIQNVNVAIENFWLNMSITMPGPKDDEPRILRSLNKKINPSVKFSVFSRRFEEWRFLFYIDLLKNGIIENSLYSFYNGHAELQTKIGTADLISLLPYSDQKIKKWIEEMPYIIDHNVEEIYNPFPDKIYDLIQQSYINVIIETHMWNSADGIYITEKTWKPILMKRPFIMVGNHNNLKRLRSMGFKTFSPYIDESYDDIEDECLRREAIVKEITRINNLSNLEFEKIVRPCLNIAKHNYDIASNLINSWPLEFKKLGIFNES